MKILRNGLAMTLMCLANFSFAADIMVSSTLTASKPISSPSPKVVAGRIELSIPRRESVSVPSPFMVERGDQISFCVDAGPDAADVFVQLNERKYWLESSQCNGVTPNNLHITLQAADAQLMPKSVSLTGSRAHDFSESLPLEKIVTLVLAPE